MMGRTHVFSGMAVGAAALPFAPVTRTGEALAWVVVIGGAAMLPDLDHQSATITRMWGPISFVAHRAVHFLGRGHRGGAHDPIVAPIAFGLLALAASLHPVSAAVMIALAVGLAVRASEFVIPGRNLESAIANMTVSALAAWFALTHATSVSWLPFAIAIGVIVHIAGDAITKSGVPLPFSWLDGTPDRQAGLLTTGKWYEPWLIAPAFLIATAVLVYLHVPVVTNLVNGVLPREAALVETPRSNS